MSQHFEPAAHNVAIGEQTVTAADWSSPVSTWLGTVITLYVSGGPLLVQFSPDQPPSPPTWEAPFEIGTGPWSHQGNFGYVRFRGVDGQPAPTVRGVAYCSP